MRQLLAMALVVLPTVAYAQAPAQRVIPFEGIEVFCQILFHAELQPIGSLDELGRDQEKTLLIVFGNPARLEEAARAAGGLTDFTAKGGNLLVATDYHHDVSSLGVEFRGNHVIQPERAYHDEPSCPWLPSATAAQHPIFHGLQKGIATNCPSFLHAKHSAVRPLLAFGNDARKENYPGKGWETARVYMAGSGKGAPPKGRMLFIAGQGMLMNGMMLQTQGGQPDNDNFDFAVNAVRWLRAGPGDTLRSRALLMADGNIITDFNMNLAPKAKLPNFPVPPVAALNRLIRGVEEEGHYRKILHSTLGDHADRVVGIILALASFGLLLYAAKKFLEGRFHQETSVPRMVGVTAAFAPQPGRIQQADGARNSRELVRAWLRAEFHVKCERWSANADVELRAASPFWSRWLLQRQAALVIALARSETVAMPLPRCIAILARLAEARAAGQLTLLIDGKIVRQATDH